MHLYVCDCVPVGPFMLCNVVVLPPPTNDLPMAIGCAYHYVLLPDRAGMSALSPRPCDNIL